jgi:hypothetical protein
VGRVSRRVRGECEGCEWVVSGTRVCARAPDGGGREGEGGVWRGGAFRAHAICVYLLLAS